MKADALRLGVFPWFAPVVTPTKHGNVSVDTFEITPETFQGFQVERTRPGIYARLKIGGSVVMSDTDMELRTNRDAVDAAKGDVLIGGLGLGIVPYAMLRKPNVRSIYIIERNLDVIAACSPFLAPHRDRVTVEHGDVDTWSPAQSKRQFDYIYFDIWTDLCTDNVAQMKALHQRYARWIRVGGKAQSWEYEHLSHLKRNGRWR